VAGNDAVTSLVTAATRTAVSPAPPATVMIMDATKCIRCALCAIRCPTGAISMEAFRYAESWNIA
jgi:ferredoxin